MELIEGIAYWISSHRSDKWVWLIGLLVLTAVVAGLPFVIGFLAA